MNIRHAITETLLGTVTFVAEDESIAAIYYQDQRNKPATEDFGPLVAPADDGLLLEATTQFIEYLAGERLDFTFSFAAHGTILQEQVWALLLEIPRGETASYGWIASQLGDPKLAQAVGQAVGRNPLSVVVPCHRVVGSTGKLTGYAGGIDRKVFLLELEESAQAKSERLF